METEEKARIVEDFIRDFISDPEAYFEDDVFEFIAYNDLGVPISQAIAYGLIESLTKEGETLLDETWLNLCKMFNANPSGEYEDLDDLILSSGDDEE